MKNLKENNFINSTDPELLKAKEDLAKTFSEINLEGLAIATQNMQNMYKTIQPALDSMRNNFNLLLKEIAPFLRLLSESFKDFDINEFAKKITEKTIYKHKELIKKLSEDNLFPPIFYLDEKITETIQDIDLKDVELKKYYIDAMRNRWSKDKFPSYIQDIIMELVLNFEEDRVYTTTLSLFTLLEYRINISKLKIVTNYRGQTLIYPSYKATLEEQSFNNELATKFLFDYINNNIFKNTDYANSLTRHVVHGHRLDLITFEGMMSLIFLYDFINNTLKIDEEILLTI